MGEREWIEILVSMVESNGVFHWLVTAVKYSDLETQT